MQGKLQETDISSLLQLVELQKRTGQLFLDVGAGRLWSIFFQKGRLLYATDNKDALVRLGDHLRRLNLQETQAVGGSHTEVAPGYDLLCTLVSQQRIPVAQAAQTVRVMIEEVLFDLLGYDQGSFYIENAEPLQPALVELEITPLVRLISARREEWAKLAPRITSPLDKPLIQSHESLRKRLPPQAYDRLATWVNGEHNLQRLARLLGRDVLTVARAIDPYVQEGIIAIEPVPTLAPRRTKNHGVKTRKVLCIDDSTVIQKSVEEFLQNWGYEVLTIGNPTEALTDVFKNRPDLILLDIAMPRLDGYELCRMIRQSTAFANTPIIMLTGKDGYVDRVRARVAGATEYLTKPFGEQELLGIVDKYFGTEARSSLHEVGN